jgi:hypothetical protein
MSGQAGFVEESAKADIAAFVIVTLEFDLPARYDHIIPTLPTASNTSLSIWIALHLQSRSKCPSMKT